MEIQKALDELKALKIDYDLDLGIDFEKAQAEINQALQLQQTGVMRSYSMTYCGNCDALNCKNNKTCIKCGVRFL